MKNTATRYLFRMIFLFSLAFLQSCGGSGGGGSSSPPGILFYTLTEDSNANGSIVENAISPSGQLYTPSPAPISTGGTYPVVFVLDPGASLAFALNSNTVSTTTNGTTTNTFYKGSIESYNTSTAQSSTGIQSISTTTTGTNPSSMAVDPGGNYLVVADHGNTNNGTSGDVEIFSIGSNGALPSPTTASLPTGCPNPDKIVFPPSGSTGATSDIFYVVCSSPELITTSNQTMALYQCPISGSCSGIPLPSSSSNTSNAISNMEFASNGTAFLPGETYSTTTSSYNAFLIFCTAPLSFSSSCRNVLISTSGDTAPTGDFAIYNNGSTTTAFIGNYITNTSGTFSNPGIFFSCTVANCASPNPRYSSSGASTFLATNPGQTSLYIVSTATPLPTPQSSSSSPGPGSIFTCPLPFTSASSCTPTETTGSYPVGITFDPSGKFAFVPTWSGTVSIFQVGANGALTSAASPTVSTGSNLNLQVVVP